MAKRLAALLKLASISTGNLNARGSDLKKTFKEGRVRFGAIEKTHESLDEKDKDQFPVEKNELGTTVKKELAWFKSIFTEGVDDQVSLELSNLHAKANLVIDGQDLGEYPATALLNMEKRLKDLKSIIAHAPVQDGSKKWTVEDEANGIYKMSEPEVKYRTKKVPTAFTKAKATDKHPEQVEVLHVDSQVGRWITQHWTGAISTSKKADVLARIDNVLSQVIAAREEANLGEAKKANIGETLYKLALGDLVK